MLLAEVARQEGLFDWLAAWAVRHSQGSAKRLFLIVYVVGTIVTVLLSNDATAVVLTPAVYAATRAAKVEPLPYLFICAFIANAASFVLPISNPANLVVFGKQMQPLVDWLRIFALPSVVAIVATYLALRLTQRGALDSEVAEIDDISPLTLGGGLAAFGIVLTAVVLLVASAMGRDLGLPTFIAGAAVTAVILLIGRQSPLPVVKDISWSVLPLVAGLFILVEGLNRTGLLPALAHILKEATAASPMVSGHRLASSLPLRLPHTFSIGLRSCASPGSCSTTSQCRWVAIHLFIRRLR